MMTRWKPTSNRARAFTFPETIVLVAIMALMAGLASQLLLMAQGFSARVQTEQKTLQTSLRARVELGRWAEEVKPAWWADSGRVFTVDGDTLVITENPGGEGRVWRVAARQGKLIASTDGGPAFTWGPFRDLQVNWWTRDHRVLGLDVTWAGPDARHFLLAWGARPV